MFGLALTLAACTPKAPPSLSGRITLKFLGASDSVAALELENGKRESIYVHGKCTYFHGSNGSGEGINPFDGTIDCRLTKTSSESELMMLGQKVTDTEVIRVFPGDRVQLIFHGAEAMDFASHRGYFCVFHLELAGREGIDSQDLSQRSRQRTLRTRFLYKLPQSRRWRPAALGRDAPVGQFETSGRTESQGEGRRRSLRVGYGDTGKEALYGRARRKRNGAATHRGFEV